MASRSRALLIVSFGALAIVVAVTAAGSFVLFDRIRAQEAQFRRDFAQKRGDLERIRAEILLSGSLAHDYFAAPAPTALGRLSLLQSETLASVRSYRDLSGDVQTWWKMLDLVKDLAARPRTPALEGYVRAQLTARRETMLRIADSIAERIESGQRQSEAEIEALDRRFRIVLIGGLGLAVAIGMVILVMTARRLIHLESESRSLAMQVVRAQEEERRSIARELHDEVGQSLSTLLLASPAEIRPGLTAVVDSVRRIALALRPSMLDDLGLVAALEWQAREVGKRSGLKVEIAAEDHVGDLPDPLRTCIYRVAQEALQNCARHSGASQVQVRLDRSNSVVRLSVEDDGRGFRPARMRGLGMLGMEERVAQLGGRLRVDSTPGSGAIVTVELAL